MSQHIRVGVVSTSWWADTMHLPALKSHPQAELIAICGRNQERATEMAQKYDIPYDLFHVAVAPVLSIPVSTYQFNHIFTQQSVGCRLFIDAIVHDHAVVPSLYDGVKVQEIMEAAMQSHEQGRWVDVS